MQEGDEQMPCDDIIDLCSSSSECSSSECSSSECSSTDDESVSIVETFSPVKARPAVCHLSDIAIPNVCVGEYHDKETRAIPIMARPANGLSVKQLFQIMIGEVPSNCVCHRKPTGVTYSSVFVIDLSCVSCLEDLRADDNGVWVHGGKPRKKYIVEFDSENLVIDATPVDDIDAVNDNNDNIFTMVRVYHRHKSTPEFQRRISYVYDSTGQLVAYAVMQYLFDGGVDIPVTVLPHGNAKKRVSAYRRTQKTTLEKVKQRGGKPKHVVSSLYEEAGGSLGAQSASELSRDRRQVYNARQIIGCSSQSSGRADLCFDLIKQCKEDSLPSGRKFVRSVSIDSGLCCVLGSESQLNDVVRFVQMIMPFACLVLMPLLT